MSDTAKARIAYVGTALENGEMEVRELVPALLAFADLIENANRVLGGDRKIKVMLNEDSLKRGSFDITFLLDTNLIEQAKNLFGFSSQVSLGTILSSLGWSEFGKLADFVTVGTPIAGGVFWLIKKIRNRKIESIEHKDNKAEITLNDGEKILTDENTLKIFLDIKCRISIEKIIEPIKHDGIESFELRKPESKEKDEPIEVVQKDDAEFFSAPGNEIEDEEFSPSPEHDGMFKIVTVNFENGKWKFNDGSGTFWASVADEQFNEKVKMREVNFACGDMLKVIFFTQQKLRNGNLTKDTVVTKVLEIKQQPQQLSLKFKQDDEDEE